MSCCVGHFRFGHFCNAAFQAGHWHFSGSLVCFGAQAAWEEAPLF